MYIWESVSFLIGKTKNIRPTALQQVVGYDINIKYLT